MLWRRLDLGRADRCERQVAEGAASVPALVSLFREQPLRLSGRIDVLGLQPLDPGEAVPLLAPPFGVKEVVGEGLRLALGEAEGAQPGQSVVGLQPR